MSEITNRASYLKGLADGLKLDKKTTEGQLIDGILDLLGDITKELESLDEEQGFIADRMDEMEDVIEVIGNEAFGDDEDDENFMLRCENCGAEMELDADDFDQAVNGTLKCPNCGELFDLDLDCDCDCDDCGRQHEE